MKIEVYAEGEPRSGKSFILERIKETLKAYGFDANNVVNVTADKELLTLIRDEDRQHFLTGDRKLIFGDWEFEIDKVGHLMKVIHAGAVLETSEVWVGLFVDSLMEVNLNAVLKKVSP
jgi:hypothetical protein